MKAPKDIHDALRRIQALTSYMANHAERLMEATTVNPNHLEPIKDAALDAHLLVTWVKDQLSYQKEKP